MFTKILAASTVLTAIGFSLMPVQAEKLDAPKLKTLIEGMGYEVKTINAEVGKEKYEFTIKTTGFNVPIGAEVSPSKNYVWLTANLGEFEKLSKHKELLQSNGKIQPSFFYATSKGALMMAAPIDNRAIDAAVMKRVTEKLADDVSSTADLWQVK